MSESVAAKKSNHSFLWYVLTVIGLNLIVGCGIEPLYSYLSGGASATGALTAAKILYYLIKVITLVATYIGFSGAFTAATYRGCGNGAKYILIPLAGMFLQFLTSMLISCFDLVPSAVIDTLIQGAMGIVLNMLFYTAMYYVIYLVSYFVFIRRGCNANDDFVFFSLRSPLCCANIVAVGISTVYNLITQTRDTLSFIESYAPLYKGETLSIIIDYIFIIFSAALAYFVMYISESVMRDRI